MRSILLALLFSQTLLALDTAYVSFTHPEGWRCELTQGVWVCQSGIDTERKESVVLSIATLATEWDTLDNYMEYLKQARTVQDEDGQTVTAKVSYVRKRNINGIEWVDSLQQDSELPGFWARYLSTVQTINNTKLAILITYIVSNDRYTQLAPQFERMVTSLKLADQLGTGVSSVQGDGPLPGSSRLGPIIKGILDDTLRKPKTAAAKEEPEGEGGSNWMVLLIIPVAAVVVIYLRKKRKQKAPGS